MPRSSETYTPATLQNVLDSNCRRSANASNEGLVAYRRDLSDPTAAWKAVESPLQTHYELFCTRLAENTNESKTCLCSRYSALRHKPGEFRVHPFVASAMVRCAG